jgi:hypothetical protein
VFDTNSGGREGVPPGFVVLTPTAPLGVPGAAVGGAVVLAPLTAPLGFPGAAVGVLLAVVAPLGEHFDGTGMPTHVPGGVPGEQPVVVVVLVHGGGVQFVVVVLVHGGGVQFVVVVLVHGGGVQFVVVVLVHGGGVVVAEQPV